MLRYLTISLISFLFLFSSASFSEKLKDIDISADSLTYSEDGTSVEAIGSVEVTTPDIKIYTNNVVCYLKDKRITTPAEYRMNLNNGLSLSGQSLDYSVNEKKGIATDVKIAYKDSILTGSSAKISDEKIELTDTTFNTCGLEPPHYHVSSYTTTLYPEDGWVIGYMGYLWLGNIPTVPVPVYVYDLSTYGKGKRVRSSDVLSVPEMGSNDLDGSYIVERVPWIANRNTTGRVVIFDTEYGGLGGGVEANYTYDDYNDFYSRLYHDGRWGYYGGITYTYKFGPKLPEKFNKIYTFLKIQDTMMLELVTNVSKKERINYQLVSMLPEVTLRMNDTPIFLNNFKVGGEIGGAKIEEVSSGINDNRTRLAIKSNYSFKGMLGNWSFGMNFNQHWYGKSAPWIRLFHNIKLSRNIMADVDGYIGHLHYYYYYGLSPFLFERYLEAPSDEISTGLGYNFGPNRIAADYSYYVPDWEPKDLDYSLSLGFHCYNLEFKYRAARKEFTFGVSLISL